MRIYYNKSLVICTYIVIAPFYVRPSCQMAVRNILHRANATYTMTRMSLRMSPEPASKISRQVSTVISSSPPSPLLCNHQDTVFPGDCNLTRGRGARGVEHMHKSELLEITIAGGRSKI